MNHSISRVALIALITVLSLSLFVPDAVIAAETEQMIALEIDSANEESYDEVVNLADSSAIQNPDTWQPAPSGIWIGSSTEESLFEFSDITCANSTFLVGCIVRFNASQIMNGASEFIIRSPIAAEGVKDMILSVYMINSTEYSIGESQMTSSNPLYSGVDGDRVLRVPDSSALGDVFEIDMTDTSIADGDCSWVVDGRVYLQVNCPIYSSTDYLFLWRATYEVDERFRVYFSPQDVGNDNITSTTIVKHIERSPVDVTFTTSEYDIDPGISFDFLNGMSNGIYGVTSYMQSGDNITFEKITSGAGTYYQTLMVPFSTEDGTLNATVDVYSIYDALIWSNTSVWNEYIFACSDSTAPAPGVCYVRITVHEAGNVTWMIKDTARDDYGAMIESGVFINTTGTIRMVSALLWTSYQMSVAHVYAPSVDPEDFPAAMLDIENEQANYYGTIIGAILMVTGALIALTGVGLTVGLFIAGVGALMIIADLSAGGTLIPNDVLPGWLSNPLDAIRDALAGAGQWLWSVGEAIYDALSWLADQIVYYGSFLLDALGLLVGLVLFFFCTWATVKMGQFGRAVARGDMDKAVQIGDATAGATVRTMMRLKP